MGWDKMRIEYSRKKPRGVYIYTHEGSQSN